MATFRREEDYLQSYRNAFSKPENIEKLVNVFISARTRFSSSDQTLLADSEVVSQAEWREIEDQSSGGGLKDKRERRARNLILKVRQKDSLTVYRGFRGFVKEEASKVDQIGVINQIFPLGVEEDKVGLGYQIIDKVQPPTEAPQQSQTQPTILWITLTKAEFDVVKRSLNLSSGQVSSRNDFYCEEMSFPLTCHGYYGNPAVNSTLFLVHPEKELDGPSPFHQLLTTFNPRPHLAIMTAPCQPIPESNVPINQSDIVVVTCKNPLSIEGEVQYLTELWKLKGELRKVFPNLMPNILFGRATNAVGEDRFEFLAHCPRAIQFYGASKEVEEMEYLAVLQVTETGQPDHDAAKLSSLALYVYKIMQSIAAEVLS